jgi:DNA-binding NarL/FixJ family response regulator
LAANAHAYRASRVLSPYACSAGCTCSSLMYRWRSGSNPAGRRRSNATRSHASWALTAVVRILIADDHEAVRLGLQSIFEERPHWEIVAVASNGNEAIQRAVETMPDVAIIDYSLPLINGIEVTRQIRAKLPQTEVLIFTVHESDKLITQLLNAGARGYVLKTEAKQHLLAAVEALASHRAFFTAQVSSALVKSYAARSDNASVLTPREREIVQLIAEGHSNKAIAGMLNIAVKTVETHRATVMRKLNLSSAAALVRYAVRNKIVEP